jgi:membrane fusion protein (multidrug efflux system)
MIETATRTDASILVLFGLKAGDHITSGVMSLKMKLRLLLKLNS